MKYKKNDVVACPHCGKDSGDHAEDLVVQGPHHIPGHAYDEECCWCYEFFTVTKISDDEYDVEAK